MHHRLPMRIIVGLAVTMTALVLATSVVGAGGSWLSPTRDRYEPGDTVTLVGYVGTSMTTFEAHGPFAAAIVPLDDDFVPLPGVAEHPVGQLEAIATGNAGYLSTRVSISFVLPETAVAAPYRLGYCNEGCEDLIGDLLGAIFYVGVSPPAPLTREWAFDEPEIANLAPDAELVGPGYTITARQALSGEATETGEAVGRWPAPNASPTVGPRPTPNRHPTPSITVMSLDPTSTAASFPSATTRQRQVRALRSIDAAIATQPDPATGGSSRSPIPAPVAAAALVLIGAAGAAARKKSETLRRIAHIRTEKADRDR